MNCENDLIVCIDNSVYFKNNHTNKNIEKFKKIIHDIRNHKKITEENVNFIKLLPESRKIEIIQEYDKIVQQLLHDRDDLINYKNIR